MISRIDEAKSAAQDLIRDALLELRLSSDIQPLLGLVQDRVASNDAGDWLLAVRVLLNRAIGIVEGWLDGMRRVTAPDAQLPIQHLLASPPPLEPLPAACRVAVVWAMAEQHGRYLFTENPLTPIADRSAETLLAAMPDDVVEDVVSLAMQTEKTVVPRLRELGAGEFGPTVPWPGDADLIVGSTLVEIKTTIKSSVGAVAVWQPICYALRLPAQRIEHLAWAFPRSGGVLRLPLVEVIARVSDGATVDELRRELADLVD